MCKCLLAAFLLLAISSFAVVIDTDAIGNFRIKRERNRDLLGKREMTDERYFKPDDQRGSGKTLKFQGSSDHQTFVSGKKTQKKTSFDRDNHWNEAWESDSKAALKGDRLEEGDNFSRDANYLNDFETGSSVGTKGNRDTTSNDHVHKASLLPLHKDKSNPSAIAQTSESSKASNSDDERDVETDHLEPSSNADARILPEEIVDTTSPNTSLGLISAPEFSSKLPKAIYSPPDGEVDPSPESIVEPLLSSGLNLDGTPLESVEISPGESNSILRVHDSPDANVEASPEALFMESQLEIENSLLDSSTTSAADSKTSFASASNSRGYHSLSKAKHVALESNEDRSYEEKTVLPNIKPSPEAPHGAIPSKLLADTKQNVVETEKSLQSVVGFSKLKNKASVSAEEPSDASISEKKNPLSSSGTKNVRPSELVASELGDRSPKEARAQIIKTPATNLVPRNSNGDSSPLYKTTSGLPYQKAEVLPYATNGNDARETAAEPQKHSNVPKVGVILQSGSNLDSDTSNGMLPVLLTPPVEASTAVRKSHTETTESRLFDKQEATSKALKYISTAVPTDEKTISKDLMALTSSSKAEKEVEDPEDDTWGDFEDFDYFDGEESTDDFDMENEYESNEDEFEDVDLDEKNASDPEKRDRLDQVYEDLGTTTTNVSGISNIFVTPSTETSLYARFCIQLWNHLEMNDEAELLQLFKEGKKACCSVNGETVFESDDDSLCTTTPLILLTAHGKESNTVAGNIAVAKNGGQASAHGSGNVAVAYDRAVASTGKGCVGCQKNMALAGGTGSYAKSADMGRGLSFNFARAEKGGRALSSSRCREGCRNNNATAIGGHALVASFAKNSQRNTAIAVGTWNQTISGSKTLAEVATACVSCSDNIVKATGVATALAARQGSGKSNTDITAMLDGSMANYVNAKNCKATVIRRKIIHSNCPGAKN